MTNEQMRLLGKMHRAAMSAVDRHDVMQGSARECLWLAYELEFEVAAQYKDSKNKQDRGMYYLSAASIAMQLGERDEMNKLIETALDGALNVYHKDELEKLRDAE